MELPKDETKIGLDDYLYNHNIEEFKKLPIHEIRKLTIKEKINSINPQEFDKYDTSRIFKRIAALSSETERDIYIKRLAKKLGATVSSIKKDICYLFYINQTIIENQARQ